MAESKDQAKVALLERAKGFCEKNGIKERWTAEEHLAFQIEEMQRIGISDAHLKEYLAVASIQGLGSNASQFGKWLNDQKILALASKAEGIANKYLKL